MCVCVCVCVCARVCVRVCVCMRVCIYMYSFYMNTISLQQKGEVCMASKGVVFRGEWERKVWSRNVRNGDNKDVLTCCSCHHGYSTDESQSHHDVMTEYNMIEHTPVFDI